MRIKTTILAGAVAAALLALTATLIAVVPAGAATPLNNRSNIVACAPGVRKLASTLKRTTEVIEWREGGEEIIIAQPGFPALCIGMAPADDIDVILENGRLTETFCPEGVKGPCYTSSRSNTAHNG